MLHRMGYRFRLHVRDLPGRPDIVLPRHKRVVLVHGCFWHGHKGCRRAARPSSNTEFWNEKLSANQERDAKNLRKLRRLGWRVLVVWECQTREDNKLRPRLQRFMGDERR